MYIHIYTYIYIIYEHNECFDVNATNKKLLNKEDIVHFFGLLGKYKIEFYGFMNRSFYNLILKNILTQKSLHLLSYFLSKCLFFFSMSKCKMKTGLSQDIFKVIVISVIQYVRSC